MSFTTPASLYADQLAGRGFGFPLWHPEPGSESGPEIGDVGFLYEGRFIRLFNVTRPVEDPLNSKGVPRCFSVLSLRDGNLLQLHDGSVAAQPVCTSSTTLGVPGSPTHALTSAESTMKSYSFSWTGRKGAIAVLVEPGRQLFVTGQAIRRYMYENWGSWYDWARENGYDLKPEEMIFVSGWTKTSQWALASFRRANLKRPQAMSFTLALQGSLSGPTFTFHHSGDALISIDQRTSAPRLALQGGSLDATSPDDGLPQDQTIFLKYYKLKRRHIRREVHRRGDPQSTNKKSAVDRNTSIPVLVALFSRYVLDGTRSCLPFIRKSAQVEEGLYAEHPDPLDSALDYILKHSSTDIAIANYDDLHAACPQLASSEDDISKCLRQTRPTVVADDFGGWIDVTVSAEPKDRKRKLTGSERGRWILFYLFDSFHRKSLKSPRHRNDMTGVSASNSTNLASETAATGTTTQRKRDSTISEHTNSLRFPGGWPLNTKGIVRRRSRREHSVSISSLFDLGETQSSDHATIPASHPVMSIPESVGTTQVILTSHADDRDRFPDVRLAELGIPVRHPASLDEGQVLPRSGTDQTTDTNSRLLEKPSGPLEGVHSAKGPCCILM